tara:strand:- start:582 stop:962 length:381 start_codon:yes stop_codon:yes gene_type:complete
MNKLLLLSIALLVGGCGKPPKDLTAEEKQVVGEYEFKNKGGDTYTKIFLENGVYEYYKNGHKFPEAKWTVSNGQIHINYPPSDNISSYKIIYRINPDRSITEIADIVDGNRTEKEESYQSTYKKIK